MKILHVVQCYHPAIGGSEWLIKNLSEQLVQNFGDEVTVFTSANLRPESFWRTQGPLLTPGIESINGVTVRRFKVFNGLQWLRSVLARGSYRLRLPGNDWLRTLQVGPIIPSLAAEVARHCRENQTDLVMATSFPFLHMYTAGQGARAAGRPFVLLGSIHTEDKWGYDRAMQYTAVRAADGYLALTPFEQTHLVAHGVAAAKITVTGGGVDLAPFEQADGAAFRARMGWGDEPIIAVVARQSALKRLDLAIQAMPRVWQHAPAARLLLAGARTSYTPELEAMIAQLPAAQRSQVTMLNNFTEEEKPALLAAATLLVHPSAYESFGIVVTEAWACAKAVVGAGTGAVASLIADGVDGMLFDFPDAGSLAQQIVTLLKEPALRERLGAAGRRKVAERFTWQRIAAETRTAYARIIAGQAAVKQED